MLRVILSFSVLIAVGVCLPEPGLKTSTNEVTQSAVDRAQVWYPRHVQLTGGAGYEGLNGIYTASLWYGGSPAYIKYDVNGVAGAAFLYTGAFTYGNGHCNNVWWVATYDSFQNILNGITDLGLMVWLGAANCGTDQLVGSYESSTTHVTSGTVSQYTDELVQNDGSSLNPQLIDVVFDTDSYTIDSIQPLSVQTLTIINHSGSTQSMSLSETYSTTRTEKWDHTTSFDYSIGIGFEASFDIGESESFSMSTKFTFGASASFGHGTTTQQIDTETHELPAAQHESATGDLTVQKGKVNVPYTLTFKVGQYSFPVSGVWRGVGYTYDNYVITSSATKKQTIQEKCYVETCDALSQVVDWNGKAMSTLSSFCS